MDTMSNPHDEVREWARVLLLDGGRDIRAIAKRIVAGGGHNHWQILAWLQCSADMTHQCISCTMERLLTGQERNRSKSNARTKRTINGHDIKIKPVDWAKAENPEPNPWPERLHEFRKRHHLTYDAAAHAAGLAKSSWSGIEYEGKMPLKSTQEKLRIAFRNYGEEIGEGDD